MTNNNPVVFDPQNQWAKELGASFIGSMAVIYFRDHWYSPQLDYLKRESHRDELRRSLSKPVNDLIDEGLLDPEPKIGEIEDEMED